MLRAFLRSLFRFLFSVLTRLEVEGLENVPPQGGVILASNHLALLDAPLVFILLERQDATGLVADKHKKNFLLHWLVNSVHGIWINRESADFQALREARGYLMKGGIVGIAPEGTRSRTGHLMPAKTGVAYLAEKACVPIVPVAIFGSEKIFHQLLRLRRAFIKVRFGEPFLLPPLDRRDRNEALRRNTDEIMCRIAVMLPQSYRGVYHDHPRLSEFMGVLEQEALLVLP